MSGKQFMFNVLLLVVIVVGPVVAISRSSPPSDRTIWLVCDICGRVLHTNDALLDRGENLHNPLTVDNAIAVTPSSANTSNDMLNDLSVDVQTSATSGTGVGVVPLASLPDATEENSAVIAGHGNATKHICKTCYDRYAWTVFRQIDDLWSAYWAGVKKSQPAVSSTPVDTSRLHWRAPK